MEWFSNLFSNWGAEILAGSGFALIAFKTFIADVLSGKKVTNLVDFTSFAKTEMNKIGKIVIDGLDEFKLGFKKEIITPLVAKIESLEQQNVNSLNVIVLLASYLNVPVAQKEVLFKALKSIAVVNDNVLKVLETSIQTQQAQITSQSVANTQLKDELKGV